MLNIEEIKKIKRAGMDLAVGRAGSQSALAEGVSNSKYAKSLQLSCSQAAISLMQTKGECSAKYVLAVEEFTGVSRGQLRPDLYPEDPVARCA